MFLHEWPTIRQDRGARKRGSRSSSSCWRPENADRVLALMFEQTDAVDYCVLGEGEATRSSCATASPPRERREREGAPRAPSASRWSCPAVRHSRSGTRTGRHPAAGVGVFPVENYLAHADNPRREPRPLDPDARDARLPVPLHLCSSPQMWTTKYVTRTPREVVDEIKGYIGRFRIKQRQILRPHRDHQEGMDREFCTILSTRRSTDVAAPDRTRTEVLDREVLACSTRPAAATSPMRRRAAPTGCCK